MERKNGNGDERSCACGAGKKRNQTSSWWTRSSKRASADNVVDTRAVNDEDNNSVSRFVVVVVESSIPMSSSNPVTGFSVSRTRTQTDRQTDIVQNRDHAHSISEKLARGRYAGHLVEDETDRSRRTCDPV